MFIPSLWHIVSALTATKFFRWLNPDYMLNAHTSNVRQTHAYAGMVAAYTMIMTMTGDDDVTTTAYRIDDSYDM